jgi:hypothetical protein
MTTTTARTPVGGLPPIRRWSTPWLLSLTATPLLAACAAGAPPLEALDLRDALTAEPDVIASMPEAARRELAERLDEADPASGPVDRVAVQIGATAATDVRAIDDAREARGDDVIVLSALERGPTDVAIHALAVERSGGAPAELPALEGPAATSTLALEQRALDGRAGRVLGRILAAKSAHHLVRVTDWHHDDLRAAPVGRARPVSPGCCRSNRRERGRHFSGFVPDRHLTTARGEPAPRLAQTRFVWSTVASRSFITKGFCTKPARPRPTKRLVASSSL